MSAKDGSRRLVDFPEPIIQEKVFDRKRIMSKKLIAVINDALSEENRQEILRAAEKTHYTVHFYQTNKEAVPHLSDTEIIFGAGRELIDAAPELKWFCALSAGVDEYTKPGVFRNEEVLLSNSSGAYGVTLAEHAIMMILEVLRRQPEYAQIVQNRQWIHNLKIQSIKDSRTTILGTGDLGREIGKRVRAFEPASITGINHSGRNPEGVFDRIGRRPELQNVLKNTDLLIMCLPGTPETFHYIGETELSCLPENAVLVNIGRGSSVDEKALCRKLTEGRLAGAGLDVFEQEPIPQDSPLWTCPRLLITPHAGGNMTLRHTVDACVRQFCEDFENYAGGRSLSYAVSREKGY